MEYVVGSVAALVSGNVTPSRPKYLKRALTPTKHQPSPNVTPKSEIGDRSIFLSPTLQKKKAIVKKSPKRIFENPDFYETLEGSSSISPKADKVKKHLKIELDANTSLNSSLLSPKSPEEQQESNMGKKSPKKMLKLSSIEDHENENTPTKKNKKRKAPKEENAEHVSEINIAPAGVSPKKKKKPNKPADEEVNTASDRTNTVKTGKKNNKLEPKAPVVEVVKLSPKKKNKKNKAKKNKLIKIELEAPTKQKKKPQIETNDDDDDDDEQADSDNESDCVNPNAITNQDTDSEHESDDEMESENDEANKKALQPTEESSDEEVKETKSPKVAKVEKKERIITDEEIKHTIFVGNVPFDKKVKKDLKRIFNKFGAIDTVRIRTIPVKDATMTPRLAIIKNELHPDKGTVNAYIKFVDASSVDKALSANNTVLREHHLRVTRSDTTGAPHDPNCALFVGNIPFGMEDEKLRTIFEKCGEIVSVRIIRDRITNAGKGFGYVNFDSKDGVELALAMSEEDLTINNRILRVKRNTRNPQKKANPPGAGMQKKFEGNNQSGENKQVNGASRRIAKRKKEEKADGPPNKFPRNENPPIREKKPKKEFVGMTADKKKKNKFDKGLKKKKILSEILTKKHNT